MRVGLPASSIRQDILRLSRVFHKRVGNESATNKMQCVCESVCVRARVCVRVRVCVCVLTLTYSSFICAATTVECIVWVMLRVCRQIKQLWATLYN